MDTIAQFVEWLMLTIGAGICLVIASVFVGLALMIMRTAWRTAGDNPGEDSELKPPYTKLRRDR